MKKQLLFIVGLFLLTIISCSKEESNEISITKKEYLVKQTIIEFNNSAVKTEKYNRLIKTISEKSLKQDYSRAELEAILQEFLRDQTQIFLDLYFQLEALGMTGEEFSSIAHQFDFLISNSLTNSKDKEGCCAIGSESTIISALVNFFCGCERGQVD